MSTKDLKPGLPLGSGGPTFRPTGPWPAHNFNQKTVYSYAMLEHLHSPFSKISHQRGCRREEKTPRASPIGHQSQKCTKNSSFSSRGHYHRCNHPSFRRTIAIARNPLRRRIPLPPRRPFPPLSFTRSRHHCYLYPHRAPTLHARCSTICQGDGLG
jgi:hypothetical protein